MTQKELKILPKRFITSEEIYFTQKPELLTTVLGSCISVTMYEKKSKLAGMIHALYSGCESYRGERCSCNERGKYVECAIHELLFLFHRKGINTNNIDVKVFGGADMSEKLLQNKMMRSGSDNVKTAYNTLADLKIKPLSADTGGFRGRKIFFDTVTGNVYVKMVRERA